MAQRTIELYLYIYTLVGWIQPPDSQLTIIAWVVGEIFFFYFGNKGRSCVTEMFTVQWGRQVVGVDVWLAKQCALDSGDRDSLTPLQIVYDVQLTKYTDIVI